MLSCAVGHPVEVHAYAKRIVIRQDGEVVGDHARRFGRAQTVYDPWHYVPVLTRKPGALRNGTPFKAWSLLTALGRVRQKPNGPPDGDCQMVAIVGAALSDGPAAVEAARAEVLAGDVFSSGVVLNSLSRRRAPLRQALGGPLRSAPVPPVD